MTLLPNSKLGPYEIRSKLGKGGMGEVYLTEDTLRHDPRFKNILERMKLSS